MQQTVPSPHAYAQQNFQIFWVGIPFRVNIDYILWIANVCEFLSMSKLTLLYMDRPKYP